MRNILHIILAIAVCSLVAGCRDKAAEQAIDSFIEATKAAYNGNDSIEVHSIMLLQHGKVRAESYLNGGSPDSAHIMHSVSKTLTAIATGIAIDQGLLSLDEKVVDIFPDKLPEEVSDNLAAMTVRDLMTMTCGQEREASAVRRDTADWVKGFLAAEVPHEPGTYFAYNSLGTYMVSAIIQQKTGMKTVDYLDKHLFKPLGIEKPVWEESPQGINCGGWGMYLKTSDMARIGQLLLNGGTWMSRRIVSEEWVKEMTSYKVSVIVLTSQSTLYQPYLDIVWEYLLPVLG